MSVRDRRATRARVAERVSSLFVGDMDGERPCPALVSTSWDDGHVLDLRLADRLEANGVKATFYVCPPAPAGEGANLTGDKLSAPQLRSLSQRFEIGAHTVTHVLLPAVDDARARDEIGLSKAQLEDVLGEPVVTFCYPGGRYLPQHVDMVEEVGFELARTIRRYATVVPPDLRQAPTTLQAFRHLHDTPRMVSAGGLHPLRLSRWMRNWDDLAIDMFELIRARGGVFHLWGHSWEIDEQGDWERLDRVLRHISGHEDVRYVTNGELAASGKASTAAPGGSGAGA